MISLPKGKIAITPIYDPEMSKGGLYIPQQAQERCDQGIVKYIAPDEETFQVGDYVLFSAYDGTLVQLEGDGIMIIMKSEAIVCKIAPPEYLNTVISGLYFRTDKSVSTLIDKLMEVLKDDLSIYDADGLADIRTELKQEVIKWETDKYFEANYEQSMDLISQNLTSLGYPLRFRFKDRKATIPKQTEITKYGR